MDVIYSLEGVGYESGGGGEDTILAWVDLCLQIVYISSQEWGKASHDHDMGHQVLRGMLRLQDFRL